MANPFRSLKYLPWLALFQSAGTTVVMSALIEYLILQAVVYLDGIAADGAGAQGLSFFLFGLLPLALAVGLGALALVVSARLFQQIPLRRDTMWALVGCVIVLLPLKNFLIAGFIGANPFGVSLNVVTIVLVAVGVFTAGRRYWRY